MLSITSETNSVQSPTHRPSLDQARNAASFPIAEETTNPENIERNKSRQSGSELPNKYGYAIFEGYAGEEYLRDLVKDILPAALYRTWAIAVGFQAPGNACYVGTGRIARKAKPGIRQIQKDLQELELRELLDRYADQVQIKEKDGTWSRKVRIIKDFRGLYDLAYEYHEWKTSAEYIEPEWEVAEYIRENEELYEKLMRFDNYRHILTCEKPGPKPKLSKLHEIYQKHKKRNEQEREQKEYGLQERNANNYLPKQLIKRSPYEETKTSQDSITYEDTDSSLHLEERVLASVAHSAIRNDQQLDQAEKDTQEQVTHKNEEEPNRQDKAQEHKQSWNKQEDEENPKEEEMPAEAVKDVIGYTIEDIVKNPLAVLTFLQQFHTAEQAKARKQERVRQAKAQRHQQARQAKRKQRKTPEKLAQVITETMQTLGGNPQYLQSDLTRATKIYWACTQLMPGFSNAWFLDQLTTAFIETANGKNIRKHVPYFFDTLERNLGLRNDELAYIRSKEVLYCDTDPQAFIIGLEQLYESSGSHLDYHQWVKQTYL
jgi:hypothetical protein